MTRLDSFIAFNAAISLIYDMGMESTIQSVYNQCKEQEYLPKEEIMNYVGEIYKPFTYKQISDKIAQLLKPKNCRADVRIVYQTVENLHKACPNDTGDWYFTGNYPTPGGNRVVNSSFIKFIEGTKGRAY